MNTRVLLVVFIMCSTWCCNARDLPSPQVSEEADTIFGLESTAELFSGKVQIGNDELCLGCENLASEALDYLLKNKTEKQILGLFHHYCSLLPSFEQQCILLVDFYGTVFFENAKAFQPGEFCRQLGLCEGAISSGLSKKDTCDICHDVVTEALLKLRDPDTELEIVKVLLNACDSVKKSTSKCKRLVFEYVPLILVNAEQFLETRDICGILRVCKSSEEDDLVESKVPLLATSYIRSNHAQSG
ncbi:hypothetical protein M569_00799 [Genlisea aurea]|uniref:Pulmonary surfactant-associated protein B n=1 Tax=Genlisea aurea TaxID=192259 RepID=S8D967_9LAMI|nr:hypothetical protein M569_00799 [Genlisea aurea]